MTEELERQLHEASLHNPFINNALMMAHLGHMSREEALIRCVLAMADQEKDLTERLSECYSRNGTTQTTVSHLALSILNETIESGGAVEIPSMGIVIRKDASEGV